MQAIASLEIKRMKDKMNLLLADYSFNMSALARALGVSPQSVKSWYDNNLIPPKQAIKIEKMTDGKFKAIELTEV